MQEEVDAWRPWVLRQLQALSPPGGGSSGMGRRRGGAGRYLSASSPCRAQARRLRGAGQEGQSPQGGLDQAGSIDGVLNSWNLKEVPVVGEEYHASIFKADEERRLVYGVIAESGMVDAQGDVMSVRTIEDMAHDFMIRFRRFDERHS
jgi:hypothetical protein